MPLAILLCALLSRVVGAVLLPVPLDPDTSIGNGAILGAFLFFVFWALSVLAWGRALALLLGLHEALALWAFGLGTAGAALSAMALGYLGLIGPEHQTLLSLLLVAGHALHLIAARGTTPSSTAGFVSGLAPAVAVATALLGGFFLSDGSDELRYHLIGPKFWTDLGRIYFPPHAPYAFQCSYWEHLFIWGNSFLTDKGASGLIEANCFARWTHAFFGYGGAALALNFLYARFGASAIAATLAAVAGLFVKELSWIAPLAKNDWGSIAWFYASAALLITAQKKRELALSGALLGLAIGAKFSTGVAAVFFLSWLVAKRRDNAGVFSWMTLGIALGLAPILLRNALTVDNPFFPALNGFFKSEWLAATPDDYTNRTIGFGALDLGPGAWAIKLRELVRHAPTVLGLLALPVLFFRRRDSFMKLRPLTGIALGAFFGLAALLKADANGFNIRLTGAALPLLAGVGTLAIFELFAAGGRKLAVGAACIFVVLSATVSALPWKLWTTLHELPSPALVIRYHSLAGDSKAWLRMNANQGELVLSSGDDLSYFVQHLNFAVITTHPVLDRETMTQLRGEDILKILRRYGARYLLESRSWYGLFMSPVAARISPLLYSHPEAIAFTGQASIVVDLEKLEESVFASCNDRTRAAPGPLAVFAYDSRLPSGL